jgi:hypothetical protein
LVFDIAPIAVGAACIVFGCPSPPNVDNDWIAFVCVNLMMTHASFDALITMIFIGPYRRAILGWIRDVFGGINKMTKGLPMEQPSVAMVGKNRIRPKNGATLTAIN